jgi:CRP/FNR family cyclic AMP-dependent transcriptional regulator
MNTPNPTVPAQEPVVERFLEHCHTKRYASGNRIIHAGDSSNTLYYITQGSVKIMLEDDTGHEMVLAYLNKGDFFGEMGLFEENERSALVIAKEQCDVAEIQYSKFRELAMADPDILMHMAGQLDDSS